MNFFEHQVEARRNTTLLVVLFIFCVLLMIVGSYLVLLVTAGEVFDTWALRSAAMDAAMSGNDFDPVVSHPWWRPTLFAYSVVGTLSTIVLGSLWKMGTLRSGGSAVAESVGARLINGETSDPLERRLCNVVEEMAIASGMPVPAVFVMDGEMGINAFAAGFTQADAVVAVTRGALSELSRDELQGVIAHEFSHILNGDMRLNIRLIGILHGILVIALAGQWIVRGRSHTSTRRNRGPGGRIFLLGLLLMALGYIGLFFGRLIKAAVSRQREFLADASAVQFTRNPLGLAGALKKIGALTAGSKIENSSAEEASHLFFGNALPYSLLFGEVMATHPPLADRINRLDPAFVPHASGARRSGSELAPEGALGIGGVIDQVGTVTPDHVAYSTALLKSMPETLLRAAHESYGAVALVYALLLDREGAIRTRQIETLRASTAPGIVQEVIRTHALLETLDPRIRLPLIDLTLPALRQLAPHQYAQFKTLILGLVKADEQINLFEFALMKIVEQRLEYALGRAGTREVKYTRVHQVQDDAITLVGAAAYAGATHAETCRVAFQTGIARYGVDPAVVQLPDLKNASLAGVDRALTRLAHASPELKAQVIDALAHCILSDNEVTTREAELLRAIAEALGCPLPPFLHARSSWGKVGGGTGT